MTAPATEPLLTIEQAAAIHAWTIEPRKRTSAKAR